MYKIGKLVNKLCPNGVNFKKLEEIIEFRNGKGHEKSIIDNGKYIVVNSKFISTNGEVKKYSDEPICPVYKNEILMVMSDLPNGRALAKCFIVDKDEKYTLNQRICALTVKDEKQVNPKFLFYYLNRNRQLLKYDNGVDQTNLKKDDILNIKIPVPPLEVQYEIVHILDDFILLSTELSTELKARQKQYEYYKEKLLKFSKNSQNVDWVSLGEYCTRLKGTAITAGKMKEIAVDNGNVRIFAGGKTFIDTDENSIIKEDIIKIPNLIVQSRGIIDFIYYDKPCSFKREMWSYTNDSVITLKFIYYYLKANVGYFRQRGSQMGSMPQISLDVTEKFKIPIPSVKEQERIVSILDRFDKLCNDTSEGLPAEIEARQKQYEYYRDRLLAFKELK